MKQIRRAGHVGNLHVAVLVLTVQFCGAREFPGVLVAQLQVSLHSPRGMFRALSVISVGEGHHNAGTLKPFHLPGGNKLINDTLRVVCKVAELSLPDNKGIW